MESFRPRYVTIVCIMISWGSEIRSDILRMIVAGVGVECPPASIPWSRLCQHKISHRKRSVYGDAHGWFHISHHVFQSSASCYSWSDMDGSCFFRGTDSVGELGLTRTPFNQDKLTLNGAGQMLKWQTRNSKCWRIYGMETCQAISASTAVHTRNHNWYLFVY